MIWDSFLGRPRFLMMLGFVFSVSRCEAIALSMMAWAVVSPIVEEKLGSGALSMLMGATGGGVGVFLIIFNIIFFVDCGVRFPTEGTLIAAGVVVVDGIVVVAELIVVAGLLVAAGLVVLVELAGVVAAGLVCDLIVVRGTVRCSVFPLWRILAIWLILV